MVLDMSAKPVDETPRPDESLKMAANIKIFEIGQDYTAVNIPLSRFLQVFFCRHIFYYIYFSAALV